MGKTEERLRTSAEPKSQLSQRVLSTHMSHSQYSVVRNFVCGGHVEQKHCEATGPPEKRHPKFSASSEAVASACWGASSLGSRSMGQENLQVILAAERRQKRHQTDTKATPRATPKLASARPLPILCSSNNSRMPRNNREKKGIWSPGFVQNSFQNPCL